MPEKVIHRRFYAGLENFHKIYQPLVDDWLLLDNSGEAPRLIEWGERP